MSNQQILEKAITKAIDGGWTGCNITHSTAEKWHVGSYGLCIYWTTGGNSYYDTNVVIFDHGFAKALWGESTRFHGYTLNIPKWQMHLQKMVIAADPIKYLGDHV